MTGKFDILVQETILLGKIQAAYLIFSTLLASFAFAYIVWRTKEKTFLNLCNKLPRDDPGLDTPTFFVALICTLSFFILALQYIYSALALFIAPNYYVLQTWKVLP